MCAKWVEGFNPSPVIEILEQLRTADGFRFEAQQQFISISSIIELHQEIPEVEGLSLITKAIFETTRGNKLDSKTLLNTISRLEYAYLSLPVSKFVLLSSLSFPFGKELRPIKLLGADIRFSKNIPRNFSRSQKLLTQVKTAFSEDVPSGFTIVRVGVKARGVHEAAEKAFDALDLLRSMWNISLNLNKYAWFVDMELEPVNQIILGPVHSIHDEHGSQIDEHYWYQKDFPRRYYPKPVDINKLRTGERNINRMRRNHNYAVEIDRVLLRYCRALDYSDLNMSFVKLWGLLEYLTDSNNRDVIARRVSFLYAENELVRLEIKYLRLYRNNSVHRGIDSSESLSLVYKLMHFVERLIFFHLSNRLKFTSVKEAAEQLLNLPPSSGQLKREIEVRKYGSQFLAPKGKS